MSFASGPAFENLSPRRSISYRRNLPVASSSRPHMDPKEAWKTCWAVNSAFTVKPKNGRFLACVICKNKLCTDSYYSSFLADAIEWPCGHMLSGYLCTKCDDALVLSVSKGEGRCPRRDCDATLGVNFEVVKGRLRAFPQLFERQVGQHRAYYFLQSITHI